MVQGVFLTEEVSGSLGHGSDYLYVSLRLQRPSVVSAGEGSGLGDSGFRPWVGGSRSL